MSQVDLPFGTGDDKIFGLENFGYTCYCNSILQCLYYTREFRIQVASNPKRTGERVRKLKVDGVKPHYIEQLIKEQQLKEQQQLIAEEEDKKPTTLARRTSNFFGFKKEEEKEEKEDPKEKSRENSNTVTISIPNIHDPNSKVLIGECPETNTIEARKKAALMKGPLLNLDHSLNNYGIRESLFSSLKDVFESIIETDLNYGILSPSYLIEVLKRENELFRSTMHQDAHEFLNFLINEVIEFDDDIKHLFQGVLTNQTKCLTCENITNRNETFLDLSIDLIDNTDLQSCLKQFSAKEMLSSSNKFYCDNCHSLQEAQKRMGLKTLPKILGIHLKRFKYSEELNRNVKLFTNLSYPMKFTLQGDIPTNDAYDVKNYELYGVVVHIGGGPHHGHYVSLVKTSAGWLLFDDETVEKIDEEFVSRFIGDGKNLATAYLLFYKEADEEDILEEDIKPEDIAVTPYNPIEKNENSTGEVILEDDDPLSLSKPALTKLRTKSNSIPWMKTRTISNEFHQQPPVSPTSNGSFWKKDKKKDDKEKKTKRLSMSFNFGKKN